MCTVEDAEREWYLGNYLKAGGLPRGKPTHLIPMIIAGIVNVASGGRHHFWHRMKCRHLSTCSAANQVNLGRRVQGFELEWPEDGLGRLGFEGRGSPLPLAHLCGHSRRPGPPTY